MGEFYSIILLRYLDLASTLYLSRSVEPKLHGKMVCYHYTSSDYGGILVFVPVIIDVLNPKQGKVTYPGRQL